MMVVRKAKSDEFSAVMAIYRRAQDFMIATGNPNQWAHRYPDEETVRDDIRVGRCHLICEDEQIHGVFALCEGEDPTYDYIEGGRWLNDASSVTIHRVASAGTARGILPCAVEYCRGLSDNVRIDTHKDNRVMQHQIEKCGFTRCGIIYLENGDPRIAYHWSRNTA